MLINFNVFFPGKEKLHLYRSKNTNSMKQMNSFYVSRCHCSVLWNAPAKARHAESLNKYKTDSPHAMITIIPVRSSAFLENSPVNLLIISTILSCAKKIVHVDNCTKKQ